MHPVAAHVPQIAAKIDEHGQQRAHVYGDIEGETLVGPSQQPRQKYQVGGAGNRQEFGKTLEHRQDNNAPGPEP